MLKKPIMTLDCTLRDGGYYNNWSFDKALVNKYLEVVANAKVDVVELGFRYLPQEQFLGPYAYTTDTFIDLLDIRSTLLIGVMVDAKMILSSHFSVADTLTKLFAPASKSPISLVRIATHFDDLDEIQPIAKSLAALGYKVGINLMQSVGKSEEQLANASKTVGSWDEVDLLYFADSLGSMESDEVKRIVTIIKSNWDKALGVHAHNNKGWAVSNTLAAIENGVTWVDSTVLGMGRGAGNAATEILLLELNQKFKTNYHPEALFGLVLKDFTPIQRQYGWGTNLLYHLAADNNIHPTYIQEMLADDRYETEDILQTIEFIKPMQSKSFQRNLLDLAKNGNYSDKDGSWDAQDWCLGKEVLILGAGPGLKENLEGIAQYIKVTQPLVLSLNLRSDFPEELIDAYVVSQHSRILLEAAKYHNLNRPIIMPRSKVERTLNLTNLNCEIWDYGLQVEAKKFAMEPYGCILPYPLDIAYALSIATIGKAKKIFLVGFDGYGGDDPFQRDMVDMLKLYQQQQNIVTLIALTPSTYPVIKGSIYAPKI
jgi:4-hydroxy 2-oxovalerate aldolase